MTSRRHKPSVDTAIASDKAGPHATHEKRTPFSTAAGLLSGALLIGALTLATPALGQEKKAVVPDKGKPVPVLVAKADDVVTGRDGKPIILAQVPSSRRLQAGSASGTRPLPPELAGLPRVSLATIQELVDQANEHTFADNDKAKNYIRAMNLRFNGGIIAVSMNICKETNCLGEASDVILVAINGQAIGGIGLERIKTLYRMATGENMEYATFTFEQGVRPDI